MRRFLVLGYGGIAYLLFGVTWLYFIGFLGGFAVGKGIDTGPEASPAAALAIDLGCLAVFFAHHSVLARARAKRIVTRVVPAAIERSTYVLVATGALILVMAMWRPLPQIVWQVEGAGAIAIRAGFWLGVGIALVASHALDGLALFGVRQVLADFRRRAMPTTPFRTPGLYRFVRHPMMTGMLLSFWAAPTMTVGHLVFAVTMTAYILAAVKYLEERDLRATFGAEYARYQREVPMLLPGRRQSAGGMNTAASGNTSR